jgi:predicted nucleotidyltransferase
MSEVLTPKVLAVLKAMHDDLQRWYYTRELARLSKTSKTTISDEFPKLVKQAILNQRAEGREVFYKLNLANPITRKLCELFETEKREEFYKENKRLSWALQDFSKRIFDFLPQVQSIVLFGSASRGEMTKTSDVDILVIVPNLPQESFNQLMKDVDKLAGDVAATYPLNLAPIAMTGKDFETAVREKKRMAQDVLRDGLILFGEDRYLMLLSRVI